MRIAAANIALRETTGVTLRAACRPVSAQVRSIGWSPGQWLGIARFTARFNIVLARGLAAGGRFVEGVTLMDVMPIAGRHLIYGLLLSCRTTAPTLDFKRRKKCRTTLPA